MQDTPREREDTYIFDPESATEMARLMMQGQLVTQGMGGILSEDERAYLVALCETADRTEAPRILDIGSGPGGWVLDTAFEYPSAEVTGIDVSKTMIGYARAQAWSRGLKNARFQEMNVLNPLEFPDNYFDFVNARFMVGFVLRDAWPALIQEFFRVTRPGGRVCLTEFERFGMSNSAAYEQIMAWAGQASTRLGYGFSPDEGKDSHITLQLSRFLRAAGYQQIQLQPHVLDFSSGAELHSLQYQNFMVIASMGAPLIPRLGLITVEEFDKAYNVALADMLSDDFLGLWYLLSARGKKLAFA
ncbi:MAG: class I SAM-dependent methyltransferase [Ktedonobacteraceae bacterium]|nr:class I SAM-dependent methyltransferase [Chloroflexota bacterium]